MKKRAASVSHQTVKTAYLDTSALAKWYFNEAGSDDVEAYIQARDPMAISSLTMVEMRCLLARRRRERHIDLELEIKIYATFRQDIRRGHLLYYTLDESTFAGAVDLMNTLQDLPLRSLDAMHLATAQKIGADILATADATMAKAARELEMDVAYFGA